MGPITFRRITPLESRIYAGGDHIGEVYRHDDILSPGRHFYVVILDEDPRGPIRVHERSRIREAAELRLRTHPYY